MKADRISKLINMQPYAYTSTNGSLRMDETVGEIYNFRDLGYHKTGRINVMDQDFGGGK